MGIFIPFNFVVVEAIGQGVKYIVGTILLKTGHLGTILYVYIVMYILYCNVIHFAKSCG